MEKTKAIFLDRDGVLNKNRADYVKSVSELEIFPFISKPLKQFQDSGFKLIIITNQSVINRGLTTEKEVKKINLEIVKFLNLRNVTIDAIYYCPHKPEDNCVCRKPKSGLLHKAIEDWNIDIKSSWFIGDSHTDVEAGKSVGCKTLLLTSKFGLEKCVEKILPTTMTNN